MLIPIDEQLKQRLVGAAVLVVLGVIFIPQVLDGPDRPTEQGTSLELPVPEPDGVRTTTIRLDQPSVTQDEPIVEEPAGEAEPSGSVESAAATTPSATDPRIVVPVAPDDQITAWAVQIYSLSDAARAEQEATSLRDAGFPAFVTRVDADGRTLYRVRVGPEQSREHAERLARRLSKLEIVLQTWFGCKQS